MVSLLVTHSVICLRVTPHLLSSSESSGSAVLQLSGAYSSQCTWTHPQDTRAQNLRVASSAPLSPLLQQLGGRGKEGKEWVRYMQPELSLRLE